MIGVIGAGFVGSAVINAFSKCDVFVVDPKHNNNTIPQLLELGPEGIFVCVPTPSLEDGSVNPAYVQEVLAQIPEGTLTVLKSTITPDHLPLGKKGLVYNPEFLTQRSANKDFLEPDSLIFGGSLVDCEKARLLYERYSDVQPCPYVFCDIPTACLVKYTLNCHFAAKVTFMNEIYRLLEKMQCSSWDDFARILGMDSRLGPTHLQVPGPDGEFGYGGACFPKDTKALLHYADSIGINLSVLRQAVEANKAIRG